MSELNTVKYEIDGNVAIVTINRPDAMNSFDAELRADLLSACQRAAADDNARVVVLAGAGRSFSAGADLKSGLNADDDTEVLLQTEYRPVLECIWNMEKPVIAAVGGSAAGIGVSFALICDLMVMGDNAFLLSPFTTISLVPDGGLSWLLVNQIGYRRAFQLSIESERISAERCVELGLANRVFPADSLLEDTIAWAKKLADRAPLSLAASKKTMRHATSGSWASTFDIEAPLQKKLRQSDDCAEGVAAFFEKRKAEFKGK